MQRPILILGKADEKGALPIGQHRGPIPARQINRFVNTNPLDPNTDCHSLVEPGADTIAWSGSPAGEDFFARNPSTWLPSGQKAFAEFLDRLQPALAEADARLLLRPHARHFLCDPHRCRSFLEAQREAGDDRFGLTLDPLAMLEPEMLPLAEDHLCRTFEMLGGEADAVLLDSSAHDTQFDLEAIIALIDEHCPASTPVIVGSIEEADRLATSR